MKKTSIILYVQRRKDNRHQKEKEQEDTSKSNTDSYINYKQQTLRGKGHGI